MQAGTRLGHYEIIELLGAGGMGEVYLGHDRRLRRKVAIKVLPAEFVSDPERLARFEQEARAAAALNHPHIAVVHDIGSAPGEDGATTHFMVQEYLEGETLREPLKNGALPLKRALDLATEIAEALAAAHAAGIIHRDLKPENIFVTKEGHAKVLDFGLAKLTEVALTGSPGDATRSPTMMGTVAGQVMGTAGYMAPEQVEGAGELDHRADLFAFGCVLYEMVSGRQPFAGSSVIQTMNRIVHEEPTALAEIDADLPLRLKWLLEKCLAKPPDSRYQTAGDLTVDLRGLSAEVESGTARNLRGEVPAASVAAEAPRGIPWTVGVPAAVVLVLVVALATWWTMRPAPPQVSRFEIAIPAGTNFASTARRLVAISPDGGEIVFNADGRLWSRALEDFEATAIRGTEGAASPFFSPDGRQLGFWLDGQLKRVSITGGAPIPLGSTEIPFGLSWSEDGMILVGQGPAGILSVAATGGESRLVLSVEEGESAYGPQLLPGGEWLLFTLLPAGAGSWDDASIVASSLLTGEQRVLVSGGRDGRYVSSGHIVYYREGSLLAVAFDAATVKVKGETVSIFDGVVGSGGTTGAAHFATSERGGLVYVPGDVGANVARSLVWVDQAGNEEPLGAPPGNYWWVDLSPDGTKVAVTMVVVAGARNIYIWDTESAALERRTYGDMDFGPVWSADGMMIAFASGTPGVAAGRDLYATPQDGSGDAVLLYSSEEMLYPMSWAADGRLVVLARRGTSTAGAADTDDILLLSADGRDLEPLVVETNFSENAAEISPDGEWLVYVSNDSGQDQVFVRRFPGPSGRWAVSPAGGNYPSWSPDGRTVFYLHDGSMWGASMRLDTQAVVLERERLFRLAGYRTDGYGHRTYDVHPETGRFLFVKSQIGAGQGAEQEARPHLNVVLNWFEELKQRVPTGR